MKLNLLGLVLISMTLLHQEHCRVLSSKPPSHNPKTQNKKRKLGQGIDDTNYDYELKQLDEEENTSNTAEKATMLSLMSLLAINLLAPKFENINKPKKKPNKSKIEKRRLAIGKRNLFSLIDESTAEDFFVQKRKSFAKFCKKKGIKISEDMEFKELWPIVKRYCNQKFELDNLSLMMIKPMAKKLYKKLFDSGEIKPTKLDDSEKPSQKEEESKENKENE